MWKMVWKAPMFGFLFFRKSYKRFRSSSRNLLKKIDVIATCSSVNVTNRLRFFGWTPERSLNHDLGGWLMAVVNWCDFYGWEEPNIGVFTTQIIHLFIGVWNHEIFAIHFGGSNPPIFGSTSKQVPFDKRKTVAKSRLSCSWSSSEFMLMTQVYRLLR